jgi:hypothetical protein
VAIERLASTGPGGHPNLGLVAHLDDGAGGRPFPTGQLDFSLDRRQLDSGAVDGLVAAPAGTVFGWVTTSAGGVAVQLPLRKTGMTAQGAVIAEFDVPREYATVVGSTAELTIAIEPAQLLVSLNLQEIDRRWWDANRSAVDLDIIAVYFLGEYRAGATTRYFAASLSARIELRLVATARPCADERCTRLGTAVEDTVGFVLPRPVTVKAPSRAFYGRSVSFSGTAEPGDAVHLAWVREPGGRPACTPANSAGRCYPVVAPTYDPRREVTRADSHGRWTLSIPLRSLFAGPEATPHPASGRYAVVAYIGAATWSDPTFNGGTFSMFVPSGSETTVLLSKPTIQARRDGSTLRVTVIVPGGDRYVAVELRLGGKRLASGRLDAKGKFTAALPAPRSAATLTATASVWGARSAATSVRVES